MSILLKKTNFAKGELGNGISDVDTTFELASGQGSLFPATGSGNPFRGVFWSASFSTPEQDTDREIVECYRSSGDDFTVVTRGAESTVAKAWDADDNFALVLTAGVLAEYESEFSNYVTPTSTTTFTNKTFDDAFIGKQISTPSNPASGYNKAYFKTNDRLYLLTSGGTESLVGNISGSAGATDNAILRADGTGGSTLQSTGITIDDNDNIVLPTTSTTGATTGVIYKGSSRWLHNYQPQYAGGSNIFLGLGAGNFTMTSGSGTSYQSSNLIGIGAGTLAGITTGYQLVAIGTSSYAAITTGSAGVAYGHFSFQRNTSAAGTAIGHAAGRYVVGYADTVIGLSAGLGVDTVSNYGYTTVVGAIAASGLTSAAASIFIGAYSGANVTSGNFNIMISSASLAVNAASTITGSSNIFIGNAGYVAVGGSSSSSSNELNIGNAIYATGLYSAVRVGIGIDHSNISARLHLIAGSTSASSAPLKFNSGSLLTSPEAGAMEFLTDAFYLTITTGAARQQIVTDTNTVTMTNKTLTAPKIVSGGFIADANGNELIIFTTTASAVNEITLANSATGGNPKFSATGGDSNIGIDFQTKGTGTYRLLGTSSQAAELRLYEDTDAGTNYTAFKVGTQSGDITYTLPPAVGASGTVLTDAAGNGTLSWATPTATGFTSRIRVKRSTTQSINDSTFTKIQFDSEDFDSLNEYDNATNYRFTVTTTGYYLIYAKLEYESMNDGKIIRCAIYKNGTKIGREVIATAGVAVDFSVAATEIQFLSATDYIEIFTHHDQGVARNIKADSFLAIHRLS